MAGFVSRIDALVSSFDQTTELRIDRVVMVHRAMALFMGLLLIFTIVWLRARLLNPWKQLLAMARAVTARDFTQRTHISGRNEMAMLGQALNTMSAELSESYAVLEQRVQEKKRPDWSRKTRSSPSCGRPTAVCTCRCHFANASLRC